VTVACAALAASAMGCEEEREPIGAPVCNAWKTEVQALVADSCTECHGATVREGDYALHDYLEAVALDTNGTARIIPGDAQSRLLTVLGADEVHASFESLRAPLEKWVVTCDARYLKTELHAAGIMQPAHADFHGALIRANLYDLTSCRDCHGEDYSGGESKASCLTCHEQGPEDCSTCHDEIPSQGAHEIHVLGGALERETSCETCHLVPTTLLSPGHVLTAEGALDMPPVEVRFTGDAIGPGEDDPAPVYVAEADRCDNVYCHGGTFDDAAASLSSPTWHAEGPLDCGSCHGFPPAEHPGDDCARCHLDTVDQSNQLADLVLHLDRRVELGPREASCHGCHGTPDNPAPAPDVEGRTDPREVTVGLHDAHLFPRRGLGLPEMACEECHRVPTMVLEFGHLSGGPAEVFPAIQGVSILASADGAMPTWDRETATCSDVYCHGGGTTLSMDTSPEKITALIWNDPTSQQVFCGSCHGVPPTTTAAHQGIDSITQCVMCHATTVDEFGNILPDGDHLNGSFTD